MMHQKGRSVFRPRRAAARGPMGEGLADHHARSARRRAFAGHSAAVAIALGAVVVAAACEDDAAVSGTPTATVGAGGSAPGGSAGAGGLAWGGQGGVGASGGQGGAALPEGEVMIGLWCGLPASELTAARFAEIAAAGFTVTANACDGATFNASYNQPMLALAAEAGLGAFVTDSRGLEAAAGTNIEQNLEGIVADYAASPALRGYHLFDEPNAALFPALATAVAGLEARDPAHFGSVNLLPDYASAEQLGTASYAEHVAGFLATVAPEFFTYDHYNFLADGSDGPTFFSNLAVVREQSLAAGTPFGQYIQAISYNGHRTPTGPEKRWAALHTLAYGGTGVFYFTYWTPVGSPENFGDGLIAASGVPTAQYAEVTDINRSVAAIGRYLAAAASTRVFHNGPLALGTVPRAPGDSVYLPSAAPVTVGLFSVGSDGYALLVNRDHASPTESDVIFATADGTVNLLDVGTGDFAPASGVTADPLGTRLHVALAPGDGLLAHLPGPLPFGPPGAEAYFGTVRADAGWLDVVDSRFETTRLRGAGWGDCPEGTVEVGRDFQSNGFWLCARADLEANVFYVGNVVADAGALYRVEMGAVTPLGAAAWESCPAGVEIGLRAESNGFWLCIE